VLKHKPRKQRRPSSPEADSSHEGTSTPPPPGLNEHNHIQSPHSRKPNADYIPELPSYSREHISRHARASTPGPVYEPPPERFTPPLQIIATPSPTKMSKSSKRKSAQKLVIKKELPEVDLSRPAPPPSPSDDPLLLQSLGRRHRLDVPPPSLSARETPEVASSPIQSMPIPQILDFLPRSASSSHSPSGPTVETDADSNILPNWSESEDGGRSDEGEYTGKFKHMTVPTKLDPPTSQTRQRQENWGRPVSPFPERLNTVDEDDHEESGELPHFDDPVETTDARAEELTHEEDMEIDNDALPQVSFEADTHQSDAHDLGLVSEEEEDGDDHGEGAYTDFVMPLKTDQSPSPRRRSPTPPSHLPVSPSQLLRKSRTPLRSPKSPEVLNAVSHSTTGRDPSPLRDTSAEESVQSHSAPSYPLLRGPYEFQATESIQHDDENSEADVHLSRSVVENSVQPLESQKTSTLRRKSPVAQERDTNVTKASMWAHEASERENMSLISRRGVHEQQWRVDSVHVDATSQSDGVQHDLDDGKSPVGTYTKGLQPLEVSLPAFWMLKPFNLTVLD
jgi:hypothetical protein